MAANFGKGLMASHVLKEMKVGSKMKWAFSGHLYFLQGSCQGSPRQTWGNPSVSKLFSSWQDSLAQYQMTSADVQVHLYPQSTWMNWGACLPPTSLNAPAKICEAWECNSSIYQRPCAPAASAVLSGFYSPQPSLEGSALTHSSRMRTTSVLFS